MELQKRTAELETEINNLLDESDDYTLTRIEDAGQIDRYAKSDSIIYGSLKKPEVDYTYNVLDFANGFRQRSYIDYSLDFPCIEFHETSPDEAFNQYQKDHQERVLNFSRFLKSEVLRQDVRDYHSFKLSFDSVCKMREDTMIQMRSLGISTPDDWVMEIEIPEKTWTSFLVEKKIQNWSNQIDYVKCVVTDLPTKAFFQKGKAVVIYPKGVINEDGKFILDESCDYAKDFITVDGKGHRIFNISFFIHPLSFKRHSLEDKSREGRNFRYFLKSGAYVSCNESNEKHILAGRNEFRFTSKYPELSFYISHG